MPNRDIPLRIKNVNGDLQLFSTSEENYLAYRMGKNLSSRTTNDPSALSLSSSNATLIGSFTDTSFNNLIGDHPGSEFVTQTVTTNLYQKTGTADESGADWRMPISYETSDYSIREMTDSDLNIMTQRLLTTALTNDYPGIYRLDSAGFSNSDYDAHLSSVFSDTRADGTTVNYNIWQRQTMTPPSTARSMFIVRTGGNTGSYGGGVREANDTQLEYTLGQRARTLITSSGIGTYQLRDNTQGAPTAPGVWVAKGVATDTKQTTADDIFAVSYTKSYSGEYTTESFATYGGVFSNTFNQGFATTYTGTFSGGAYAGNYVRAYTGTYRKGYASVRNFVGTVSNSYTGSFTGSYTGSFNRNYTGTSVTSTVNYQKVYGGMYLGLYDRNYVGFANYGGAAGYAGFLTPGYGGLEGYAGFRTYTGTYRGPGEPPFFETFIGFYQGPGTYQSVRTYETAATYTSVTDYSGAATFQGPVEKGYLGAYITFFTGNFTSNLNYGGTVNKSYTGSFSGSYTGSTNVNYASTRFFATDYAGSFNRTYTGNFGNLYTGNYTKDYLADYTAEYAGDYARTFTQNYAGTFDNAFQVYSSEYAGLTIQSTTEVIKTYTLYVRTS